MLDKLRTVKTLEEFSQFLSIPIEALKNVVLDTHKKDLSNYISFEIQKKTGGIRKINAPINSLKKIQRKLAKVLQSCLEQIYIIEGHYTFNKKETISISHGFMQGKSIITNATPHRNKNFVLNIDIKDFFDSFHYGRIYGYFTKNKHFELCHTVAMTIANICCHQGKLPQGAPTSPIISNLIAGSLDINLSRLSLKNKLYYTRYADDLSFSTNQKLFPSKIAEIKNGKVLIGKLLEREINRQGFKINDQKNRLQYKNSRQDVTGLIVNHKINVRYEYRNQARILWHKIRNGKEIYKIGSTSENIKNINYLIGVLSHIHNVRRSDTLRSKDEAFPFGQEVRKQEIDKILDADARMYRDAIFFKNFVINSMPVVFCEGKTDIIYLRSALKALIKKHRKLISKDGLKIDFVRVTKTISELFRIGGGTGDLRNFISNYTSYCSQFHRSQFSSPVIILIDNDSGATTLRSLVKKIAKKEFKREDDFIYIVENLYLLQTPLLNGKDSSTESFFDNEVLNTVLNGKTFSPKSDFDSTKHYGKNHFSKYVIARNVTSINFDKFNPLFESLKKIILDYRKKIIANNK